MGSRAVCHLNIVGFRAVVAAIKDRSLREKPYVIAGATGGRSLAWDVSPLALREGIMPGMPLAVAQRLVKDLTVLAPDPASCTAVNAEIEKAACRYAPIYETDKAGNWYLDISGTTTIFGPPADCSQKILREVFNLTGIRPAAAVAGNKLVSKVATRAIRPVGLIQVRAGTEAAFLAHQDIRLLPGMGPKLLRTAEVTGIREIGELALLSDSEALSLFGKSGIKLRDTALGIDNTPVIACPLGHCGDTESRKITQRLDLAEDTEDEEIIHGGIVYLAENAGLEMRSSKLGAGKIELRTTYSDGVYANGEKTARRLLVTDNEIAGAVETLFNKITVRRLRIKSIALKLSELTPLQYQPDLFLPVEIEKDHALQDAADKVRKRYGHNYLMKGSVMTAYRLSTGLVAIAGNND